MSLAEAEAKELELEGEAFVGRWTDVRQRLLRNPSAIVGLVLIALFVLVGVLAPLLAPYNPRDTDLAIIRPGLYPGPSAQHLLGVDQLGRDILSRIIYGARSSLIIGLVALGFGATVALGVRRGRIVLGHIVPNSIAPVIVQATLALATAIIDAAGLAYLGLGSSDPGVPEWGRMLAETQSLLQNAPHAAIFPGLAIVVSCLGFYLLGEGLREALDPKFRR